MKHSKIILAVLTSLIIANVAICEEKRYDDVIELRSGSEINARVIDRTESENRKYVIFETESGSVVKLEEKLITRVIPADVDQKRYYAFLEKLPNTVEAHWEIVDWCKSQTRGRSKFKDQIQYHLENIIALNPNERKARQLLGYEDFNGQWTLKALRYQKSGYIRENSNWIPEMALKIERNNDKRDAQAGAVREQFSRWEREVRNGRLSATEIERMLYEIVTPETTNYIFEESKKKKNQAAVIRKMYVEAYGRTPSRLAAGALVYYGITDPDSEIRERAMTLLLQPQFDQDYAMSRMVEFLKSASVARSERAAIGIRELSQVPGSNPLKILRPLIESLVAVREVPIAGATPAGGINSSFSSNGGLSFTAGGGPQTRKQEFRNASSLSALQRITGKNFQYDEELWNNFFVDNYTQPTDGVRGDN